MQLFQVDAFTDRVFGGNPAAVVPLEHWLGDDILQAIAAENNLSETAFFVPTGDRYHLRWFTPTVEIALCGHATLASAHIVFTVLDPSRTSVEFETLSGILGVQRDGERLVMDFPSRPPVPCETPDFVLAGLKLAPEIVLQGTDKNYYAVYGSEAEVIGLTPDFTLLAHYPYGFAVTAPGENADFVSRYFVPAWGIPEDPVTGSSHCGLIPYWAERLGKTKLLAHQVSQRGGKLFCELQGERVRIGGQAVTYLTGTIVQ